MKNLKVGNKLIVAFAVVMALFIMCAVVGVSCLMDVSKNMEDFYNNSHQVVTTQLDMRRGIQKLTRSMLWACTDSTAEAANAHLQDALAELEEVQSKIPVLQEKFRGDPALVQAFVQAMEDARPARERIVQLAGSLNSEEAVRVFNEEYEPAVAAYQEYLTEIGNDASKRAADMYAASVATRDTARVIMGCVLAVGALVIILFCLYITRSITRPIREIQQAATEMAEGNLSVTIGYESRDELGVLSQRIRDMAQNLKTIIDDEDFLLGEMAEGNFDINTRVEEQYKGDFYSILLSLRKINRSLSATLTQINQSADQVSSGSDQVSSGAQALSQGATEQASSIEELAATITDISGQIQANAQGAQQASARANSVGEEILQSNQQMQQMMAAMGEISQASGEIGKIIKTIEDIAFQTNILALNAAVEAARAGAAGKGFAVVADEVRNLASKSAEASKNTAALIESSIKAVENGTAIAEQTAQQLVSVVEGAKEIVTTIDQIAEASNAQAGSITQVTAGVDQISAVVQTNSATAEESAAASEELSGQAQMLKNLVGRFTLRRDETAQAGAGTGEAAASLDYAAAGAGDKY